MGVWVISYFFIELVVAEALSGKAKLRIGNQSQNHIHQRTAARRGEAELSIITASANVGNTREAKTSYIGI